MRGSNSFKSERKSVSDKQGSKFRYQGTEFFAEKIRRWIKFVEVGGELRRNCIDLINYF